MHQLIIFVVSNFSLIKIVVGMRMTKLEPNKSVNTPPSSLVSFITVSLCRAQSLTQQRERERERERTGAAQRLIMKSSKVFRPFFC